MTLKHYLCVIIEICQPIVIWISDVCTQRNWDPVDWQVLCTPVYHGSPTQAAVDLEQESFHALPACMIC